LKQVLSAQHLLQWLLAVLLPAAVLLCRAASASLAALS
jgi:hypothetical protein